MWSLKAKDVPFYQSSKSYGDRSVIQSIIHIFRNILIFIKQKNKHSIIKGNPRRRRRSIQYLLTHGKLIITLRTRLALSKSFTSFKFSITTVKCNLLGETSNDSWKPISVQYKKNGMSKGNKNLIPKQTQIIIFFINFFLFDLTHYRSLKTLNLILQLRVCG